jgi:glycosyltransferase involved in cell wall biosynthesis
LSAAAPVPAPVQVSVVIPVYNSAAHLRSCLRHLRQSTFLEYECIVVDDGSTDESRAVAAEFGAIVQSSGGRRGPAYARNVGATFARGEILFFIDADVCVYPSTLQKVYDAFAQDSDISAVMGSYDDRPECPDFLSVYRNLMHCYVHHHGRREACTFWSGCGAIRKAVFLEMKGFDESYGRPSIEDIELGYRLNRAHKKVILDPGILVKHLKRWTFLGLVKTDIIDRGIPWTELILRDRVMPDDLNTQFSQRVSVALIFLLALTGAAGVFVRGGPFLLTILTLLFLVVAQVQVSSRGASRRPAMIATLVMVSALVYLAVHTYSYGLLPPVLLAYVLLFLRHRYAFASSKRKRITGLFCGGYLIFVMLFVLIYLPVHPLVFCFYLLLSVLILLNLQFYMFLAGHTGRLYALGAVPFHLLFHFYNGVSFAIGLLRHYLLRRSPSAERKHVSVSLDQ